MQIMIHVQLLTMPKYSKKYAHGLQFIVFCCDLILINMTYIIQDNSTGTKTIFQYPQCQWNNLKNIYK